MHCSVVDCDIITALLRLLPIARLDAGLEAARWPPFVLPALQGRTGSDDCDHRITALAGEG